MKNSIFTHLKNDIPASLVVFLVALPLCLGIALASGAPLFSGLIAGAIGGIVIGIVSNSNLSVSGPAAGLTAIVFSSIQKIGIYEAFLLAVVLAGIIQIVLGSFKAGIIGEFVPSSVIKGMLSAIGIILILKQIPHAVGYDKDYEGDDAFLQADGQNTFSELIHLFNEALSPGSMLIAFLCILLLISWESKFVKKNAVLNLIPGPLLAVILGVILNSIFQSSYPNLAVKPEHLVSIPIASNVQEFVGNFKFPDFSAIGNGTVWSTAFVLAIVASLETLLCIEAVDKLDPLKRLTNTNRELVAQGIGNITSGLIGGLPVTSVIVRSSANVQSGGRTKLAAIFHGILLLLCVVFIPKYLNLIPLSSLAAILIMVGYKLAKPAIFIEKWGMGRAHFIPYVITIVAILMTDLLIGILIGIAVGAHFVFLSNYKSAIEFIEEGTNRFKIKIKRDLSFVNKASLKAALAQVPDDSHVDINFENIHFIDLDNAEILKEFQIGAKYRNIEVSMNRLDIPKKAV